MKIKLTFLMSTLAFSAVSQPAIQTHKDSLNTVVEEYYRINLKIFQSNSTPADIDSLFLLFTDDFTYVHPKYGGTYSRQDLLDGYKNNQKNGGYDGRVRDIKVINQITGLNAVTTQKRFITTKKGNLVEGELEMTLFEFREGKIFRIFEFW